MIADETEEVFASAGRLRQTLNAICLICILALSLVTYVAIETAIRPIKTIENSVLQLGSLQLSAAEDVKRFVKRKDEVGNIARAVQTLCVTLKAASEDIARILGEMANGNLSVDVSVNQKCYIGDFEILTKQLTTIQRNLVGVMEEIYVAANQVDAGSVQLATGAQLLSQGATNQAVSVDKLAHNIGEIEGKVRLNSESCSEASRLMVTTAEYLSGVNEKMQGLNAAVGNIDEASNGIYKIIKAIEDIAFQTNILALNAAVEAARAGEAGKGFAVVADEVRNLAAKSADAVSSTTELIHRSIDAVKEGTRITEQTVQAVRSLDENTEKLKRIVDEIKVSSGNQAEMVSRINGDMIEISRVVQSNSATAEESAASSQELSGQAGMLKGLIGRFRLR